MIEAQNAAAEDLNSDNLVSALDMDEIVEIQNAIANGDSMVVDFDLDEIIEA